MRNTFVFALNLPKLLTFAVCPSGFPNEFNVTGIIHCETGAGRPRWENIPRDGLGWEMLWQKKEHCRFFVPPVVKFPCSSQGVNPSSSEDKPSLLECLAPLAAEEPPGAGIVFKACSVVTGPDCL